jgi:tRNA (cytidine/uridine-2'-O-)-methyltransferase
MQETRPNIRIALYQPDIPGNTGTILRRGGGLGLGGGGLAPARGAS